MRKRIRAVLYIPALPLGLAAAMAPAPAQAPAVDGYCIGSMDQDGRQ